MGDGLMFKDVFRGDLSGLYEAVYTRGVAALAYYESTEKSGI